MSSPTYAEKLKDPRWQRKRAEILERDNFTCRDCGNARKTLHVHHCHYEKGEPWEINSALLLTVCDECHQTRGELESDGKRALGFIFARLRNDRTANEDGLAEFVADLVMWSDAEQSVYPPILIPQQKLKDLLGLDHDYSPKTRSAK